MKKLIWINLLLCVLVACNETPTTDTTTTGETTEEESVAAVELEDKVDYSEDSLFRMEYQMDKNSQKKHGLYKEFDVTTGKLLAERHYKMDRIHGIEKFYFSGSGALDGEFEYKNGVHDGPFTYYYEDGQKKQTGVYKAGKVEGMLIKYYPGGQMAEEVTHVEGVTQGVFKEYNENGTLKAEGEYTSKSDRENLEQGLLKLYDENGELEKKMICQEGQCCTIWTVEEGEVKPSSKLCDAIINSQNQ